MIEARCSKCHQIFIPHSESAEDLIHGWDEERSTECGGVGVVLGIWVIHDELTPPPDNERCTYQPVNERCIRRPHLDHPRGHVRVVGLYFNETDEED